MTESRVDEILKNLVFRGRIKSYRQIKEYLDMKDLNNTKSALSKLLIESLPDKLEHSTSCLNRFRISRDYCDCGAKTYNKCLDDVIKRVNEVNQ